MHGPKALGHMEMGPREATKGELEMSFLCFSFYAQLSSFLRGIIPLSLAPNLF